MKMDIRYGIGSVLLILAFFFAGCQDDEIEQRLSPEEVRPYLGVYRGKMVMEIEKMEMVRLWQQVKVDLQGDTISILMEEFRVDNVYFGDLELHNIEISRDGDRLNFNTIQNVSLNNLPQVNIDLKGSLQGERLDITYVIRSVKTPTVKGSMSSYLQHQVLSDSVAIVGLKFSESLVLVQPEMNELTQLLQFFVSDTLGDSTRVVLHPELILYDGCGSAFKEGDSLNFTLGNIPRIRVWAADSIHMKTYAVQLVRIRSYHSDFEKWSIHPVQEHDSLLTYLIPNNWNSNDGRLRWFKMQTEPDIPFYEMTKPWAVERVASSENNGRYGLRMTTVQIAGNDTIPSLHAGELFMGDLLADSSTIPAPHYGVTFENRPIGITGQFRYNPGNEFFRDNEKTAESDSCYIRMVLYEVQKTSEALTAEQMEHDSRIVAVGSFTTGDKELYFNKFDVRLVYLRPFNTKRVYKLGVFMRSSKYAPFAGAPGSTLTVDNVMIMARGVFANNK